MVERSGYPAVIAEVEVLTPTLRKFVIAAQGTRFPAVSAGSHVVLGFGDASRRYKNAYSVVSATPDGRELSVIVRRAPQSRGGSAFLHDQAQDGTPVTVLSSANLFPVVKTARRHLMLSAGVGITPFLAHARALEAEGADYTLHHFCRPEEKPAFEALLATLPPGRIFIHDRPPEDAGMRERMAAEGIATHLYFCGPEGFMGWVKQAADALGFVAAKVHSEHFFVPEGGRPFTAVLARSGERIEVAGDETLLEALERSGVDAPCMCRGGACGACALEVLDGVPEHRDHVLSEQEKAEGRTILTCVSRARTDTLTLNL